MSSTNWAKNQVQDFLFGSVSFTPPTNYYLALSTTTVSSSGSNLTEPSGAGYARVIIPNSKSYFTYSSGGCLVNSASIVYPISTGSWGTIVDVALVSGSTSGSVWFYTTLGVPKIVQDATTISFAASAITISQS
jgi:hypothetical protein